MALLLKDRFMISRLSFALIVLLSVGACSSENSNSLSKVGEAPAARTGTLPPSNGGLLDMIVVAEEAVWQADPGLVFRKYFEEMVYGLPQPEPEYTVRQVIPRSFNELLQRSRYIVRLSLGDSAYFYMEEERWAKEQLVVHLQATSESELVNAIRRYDEDIDERIQKLEIGRQQLSLNRLQHDDYPGVLSKHHCAISIPRDYELSVEEQDFLMYWKSTNRADHGIMIYYRPLDNNQSLLGEDIIPLRDSLTKIHVLGAREGSYMITEDLIKPQITPTEVAGNFALEARGLWRTEGDLMGGPFLSYTIYDEKNQQVIYLDAFMSAPNRKKRNSMFEMEAILRSLKIK